MVIQCCEACAGYGGPGIKMKIQAQSNHLMLEHLYGQQQLPSWYKADINLMFPFSQWEALRLVFAVRELFATACVAALTNAHKFLLAQYCSVTGTMEHLLLGHFCALIRKIPTESNSWSSWKDPPQRHFIIQFESTWRHCFFGADLCNLVFPSDDGNNSEWQTAFLSHNFFCFAL